MLRFFYAAILLLSALPTGKAEPVVIALTPIVADVAQQIGGDHLSVISLMSPSENPHTYDPKPGDLAQLAKAQLILASGKGLEAPFLEKITKVLSPEATLLEVGRKVPSCIVDASSEVFVCCPDHAAGAIDPHWWHSVKGMKRAVREVEKAFIKIDPANSAAYKQRAKAYTQELNDLDQWIKTRLADIPRKKRFLTTAHAAFAYFCKDYGFKSIPVQGLTKEQNPAPQYLAETIQQLVKHDIAAVFPEEGANPKVLQSMVAESGVTLSAPLLADNLNEENPSYIEMIRYNINTIYDALK